MISKYYLQIVASIKKIFFSSSLIIFKQLKYTSSLKEILLYNFFWKILTEKRKFYCEIISSKSTFLCFLKLE